MSEDFEKLLDLVKLNQNDPDVLSKLIIEISAVLYLHNQIIAQADLDEKKVLVRFLDSKKEDGKSYSVAESDARAIVQTSNLYKLRRLEAEAIIEVLNSIKQRLAVLSQERKLS